MDIILLVARLVLAGTFLVAGIGKLADLAGSRQAVQSFGVPVRLAPLAGLALPIGELVVAVALIPVATAWWGALGALLLLITFLAAIGYNISQGRTPDCHCFGQIHSEPAGPRTMVRNGILAALAASIVALGFGNPGSSAVAWFGDVSGTGQIRIVLGTLVGGAIIVMGGLLAQIMLQNGRLLIRLEALEEMISTGTPAPSLQEPEIHVGMPAPTFTLPNLEGDLISLDSMRASGKPTLLVFTDPNCRACNELLPSLSIWHTDGRLSIAMISRGTPAANHAKVDPHGLSNVLLQKDHEIAYIYGANVTPTAVLIRPDGVIDSPLSRGLGDIQALVARTLPPTQGLTIPRHPEPIEVGIPAHSLS